MGNTKTLKPSQLLAWVGYFAIRRFETASPDRLRRFFKQTPDESPKNLKLRGSEKCRV